MITDRVGEVVFLRRYEGIIFYLPYLLHTKVSDEKLDVVYFLPA